MVQVDEGEADDAFLGNLIFGFVLVVGGLNFRIARRDLRFEVLGLYQRVVQLDLFVAVAEFILQILRTGADAVGDQIA